MTRAQRESHYSTPEAMSAALTDNLRRRASETGLDHAKMRRQFAYDRLLARVFAGKGDWVLKGGTALLARVRDSRHTLDIDLAWRTGDLTEAVTELRRAAAVDLKDHFRFRVDLSGAVESTRPGISQAKLEVEAFVGARQFEKFSIDVVLGSLMTAAPEPVQPSIVLEFDGLVPPTYLLYPVVDHIADKVCATFETYGPAARPSSRARDLVDLVVIARSQSVDAAQLLIAIDAERQHRGLAPIAAFSVPPGWDRLYAKEAKAVSGLDSYRRLPEAVELASRFLDPVLSREKTSGTWSPSDLDWR